MSYVIKLIDNTTKIVDELKGKRILAMLDCKIEPENEAQEKFLLSIVDIQKSPDAIKEFIRAHIKTEPAKLKDDKYRKEWIANYERRADTNNVG